jgi:hypothetical protein
VRWRAARQGNRLCVLTSRYEGPRLSTSGILVTPRLLRRPGLRAGISSHFFGCDQHLRHTICRRCVHRSGFYSGAIHSLECLTDQVAVARVAWIWDSRMLVLCGRELPALARRSVRPIIGPALAGGDRDMADLDLLPWCAADRLMLMNLREPPCRPNSAHRLIDCAA